MEIYVSLMAVTLDEEQKYRTFIILFSLFVKNIIEIALHKVFNTRRSYTE